MFVGREEELSFLEDAYASTRAQLVFVYGRRRVGKTELLNEFRKDKPCVFVAAKEAPATTQLADFSQQMFAAGAPAGRYLNSYRTWEDALEDIASLPGSTRKLVIIDEFPYLVRSDASLPSTLQHVWDHLLSQQNVMIILCGSSMSFIEKEILNEKNPLYGRVTGLLKLQPLPYWKVARFYPAYSPQQQAETFAVLGGIPHYLLQFDPDKTQEENIKAHILRSGCALYSEPEFLMRQEFRETAVYNSIVQAVALGATQLNEISQKTMLEAGKLSPYIKNLIEVGILEREFPVGIGAQERTKGRRGLYRIKDNFFRFWYAFVFSYSSALDAHDVQGVWSNAVWPVFNNFASAPFEGMCQAWLQQKNAAGAIPFYATEIGRWWNGCEIDIMACDAGRKHAVIAECKFKNSAVGSSVLRSLEEKGEQIKPTVLEYYLFSKSGFTDELKERAHDADNIHLIDCEELYSLL